MTIKEIEEDLANITYNLGLVLSALRNLLEQNNSNGVNNHLIQKIEDSQ